MNDFITQLSNSLIELSKRVRVLERRDVGYSPVIEQLTAKVADVASTELDNSDTVGLYRVNCVLETTTGDGAAGSVTITFSWTDGAGAATSAVSQVLTAAGRTEDTIFIQLASGSISYAITHAGIYGTAVYAAHIVLERLS